MTDVDSDGTAPTVLVAGTASHVGKSTVAAGLCRLLTDRGFDVAPFKAQNMSNNARAVPGGEIGVSQYVQARAARTPPSTDHNPVLLKPRGDGESQLIIDGEAVGHYDAGTFYDQHWEQALEAAETAHNHLAREHDIVVAEGAGSIAEPNLRERDLANVETARFADAGILLVGDIERGGVFASIVGTLELVPDDIREQVAGVCITKFRGDRSILRPALDELETEYDIPVLGVLPHDDPGLPAEDSLSLPPAGECVVRGGDDDVPEDSAVHIAVPRLPRISNFTDLEPLARVPGVRVVYTPLEGTLDADALILPGTKNTVDDLHALHDSGMAAEIIAFEGPIIGLCGGYQLLGERLTNASLEGTGTAETVGGLGLLPVETRFESEKHVEPVTRNFSGCGPLAGVDCQVSGYEIHMGRTRVLGDVERPFEGSGAAVDNTLGTYLHGLFENEPVRRAFVSSLRDGGETGTLPEGTGVRTPYDDAADLLEEHLRVAQLLPGQRREDL